jgi:hypothetical protein
MYSYQLIDLVQEEFISISHICMSDMYICVVCKFVCICMYVSFCIPWQMYYNNTVCIPAVYIFIYVFSFVCM